jgi:hypothetical protein
MRINCLSTQEDLFETRLLSRVSQPVFLAIEAIPSGLDAPLVLYGNWHPQGFRKGLDWLSGFVFHLPKPCILLPPFDVGTMGESLGLMTALSVQNVNTDGLLVLPEAEALNLANKNELQVQTDYAFSGPTGKAWLTATENKLAVVDLIQPKNTSTPLLLCGARLLSASGLSNNDDRLALLEGILTWATRWSKAADQIIEPPSQSPKLDEATWHVVCILAAGARTSTVNETISLARSLLGVEISLVDVQIAHERLVEYGLAQRINENLLLNLDALETYTQQIGLWAYVRALRKDFERMRS